MIVCSTIGTAIYAFTIYLLYSSVKLLRKYVANSGQQKSNEVTAWLHIVMVICLLVSSIIYNSILAITNGLVISDNDIGRDDITGWEFVAKDVKIIGEFFACMILIYMFWGYAFEGGSAAKKCNE